jgi:hypothetical protein
MRTSTGYELMTVNYVPAPQPRSCMRPGMEKQTRQSSTANSGSTSVGAPGSQGQVIGTPGRGRERAAARATRATCHFGGPWPARPRPRPRRSSTARWRYKAPTPAPPPQSEASRLPAGPPPSDSPHHNPGRLPWPPHKIDLPLTGRNSSLHPRGEHRHTRQIACAPCPSGP